MRCDQLTERDLIGMREQAIPFDVTNEQAEGVDGRTAMRVGVPRTFEGDFDLNPGLGEPRTNSIGLCAGELSLRHDPGEILKRKVITLPMVIIGEQPRHLGDLSGIHGYGMTSAEKYHVMLALRSRYVHYRVIRWDVSELP